MKLEITLSGLPGRRNVSKLHSPYFNVRLTFLYFEISGVIVLRQFLSGLACEPLYNNAREHILWHNASGLCMVVANQTNGIF